MGHVEPLVREMSWPDLIKTLVWLATSEDVPAMEQIQAATLVPDDTAAVVVATSAAVVPRPASFQILAGLGVSARWLDHRLRPGASCPKLGGPPRGCAAPTTLTIHQAL